MIQVTPPPIPSMPYFVTVQHNGCVYPLECGRDQVLDAIAILLSVAAERSPAITLGRKIAMGATVAMSRKIDEIIINAITKAKA